MGLLEHTIPQPPVKRSIAQHLLLLHRLGHGSALRLAACRLQPRHPELLPTEPPAPPGTHGSLSPCQEGAREPRPSHPELPDHPEPRPPGASREPAAGRAEALGPPLQHGRAAPAAPVPPVPGTGSGLGGLQGAGGPARRHRAGRLPRQRGADGRAAPRAALPRGGPRGVRGPASQDGRPPAGTPAAGGWGGPRGSARGCSGGSREEEREIGVSFGCVTPAAHYVAANSLCCAGFLSKSFLGILNKAAASALSSISAYCYCMLLLLLKIIHLSLTTLYVKLQLSKKYLELPWIILYGRKMSKKK